MAEPTEFGKLLASNAALMLGVRELLAADAALMLGVAEAQDVAAALQRYWDKRHQNGVTFEEELRRIAGLPEEALTRVRAEVDRLVQDAGGDARIALTRRGGVDRSVHVALGKDGRDLTRALGVLGVPIRAPLRSLPPERYADFEVAGHGGMGLVYAAVDTEMNRRVAFKMVRIHSGVAVEHVPSSPLEATQPEKHSPDSAKYEQWKARLVQEAWVTGRLEHPGIVPVYEIGQTPAGIPYYTMRFVRGERTLADAIAEKRKAPYEERLALLEPFLKVCDTLRYAHDNGVVHRDLKPANVALGQYGEVVLLDWGLARLEGREDVASSAWQERVQEMRRDAGFHTMEGGAVGTAGYMSPEATLGRLAEVDQRSDVYSLGAILFEILTGRLPFEFRSFAEYASVSVRKDAPAAREVDPSVPDALSALCDKALSRERALRPTSAQELADAVRAWQAENAVDREVEALLRDARSALEGAAEVEGEARLVQVSRAAAALAQVKAKRPEAPDLVALHRRAEALREDGIGERERAATRRLLRRVAVGGLAAAAVAAFVVVTVVEGKREEAEEARAATQVALADVLRLADSKKVRDLVNEADELWPLVPEKAEAMAVWIGRAKDVLLSRDGHRERLRKIREAALPYAEEVRTKDHAEGLARVEAANIRVREIMKERLELTGTDGELRRQALDEDARLLREEIARLEEALKERRTWGFADPNVDWQHAVLADLVAGLDGLAGGGNGAGAVASVEKRHGFVTELRKRSIDDHAQAWKETTEGIAASPKYGGLRISPQLGLVPLGEDPQSGLFEFAHLGSGSLPTRDDATKRLVYADDAAVVLVLIPGGTFRMGAQRVDADGPNYDPEALDDESPVHRVTLSPFFLGKHEVTQAQWKSMAEGRNPSNFKAGKRFQDRLLTARNPVEQVPWDTCVRWLSRNRLTLPTEAQWEYACRAGTDTPRITVHDVAALGKVANIADAYVTQHGSQMRVTPEVEDGHGAHAPVGSFAANPFGLHDVLGNVWEWCRDVFRPYSADAVTDPNVEGSDPRLMRGGAWSSIAICARSSYREAYAGRYRNDDVGARPARPLEP